MIKLKTDCNNCIHKKVCKNLNNAENCMNKLKKLTFGKGPNDDYDWESMMVTYNVIIEFSCPDYCFNSNTIVNKR